MTKNRSNKKSRNKYKVSGGVGGRGGRGLTNNKKTRPLGGRRNRSQNQEGGMKYRTMLEKNVEELSDMGSEISKIIPRLFAGLYASWGARHPDAADMGQAYTYADIGGSLTHNGANKFILKTRAGLNTTTKNLSDYVLYSDWYVYELQPTETEIAEYKKLSKPLPSTSGDDKSIIESVWQGQLTKAVWTGEVGIVDAALTAIRAQYSRAVEGLRSDLAFFGQVAYSIITSTTLSRETITAPEPIKNASHTLLYTACRSPKVTPEMIIMLIGHGCNVNQPNGAVRFTAERSDEWASGANLTPLWGLVKCIIDNDPVQPEVENRILQCLEILIGQGANTCWRNTDAQTISEYIEYMASHQRSIRSERLNQKISQMNCAIGALLDNWKTIEKRTRNIQYYRHDDGGTTYQRPDKELNLSLNPTPIADAATKAVAAKTVAAKTVAAAVAKAAPSLVATPASVVAAPQPGIWEWENNDGDGWELFESHISAALDRAHTQGYLYITIVTKNPNSSLGQDPKVTWLFDMQAKTQTNIKTGSRRRIQRKPDVAVELKFKGPFDETIVAWYLQSNPNPLTGNGLREIEVEYKNNPENESASAAAAAATIGTTSRPKPFNFKTMNNPMKLTRVCFNPFDTVVAEANAAVAAAAAAAAPSLVVTSGLVAASSSSSSSAAAAPATQMSVDRFCTMLREHGDNDTKISTALTEGRLTDIKDKFAAITKEAPNGNTALYCACRSPKTTVDSIRKMVEKLVLDVNVPNSVNKSTPLHGLVQRLREAIDAKIKADGTPSALFSAAAAAAALAAEYGRILAIMKFLVEQKADCTLANTVPNGGTALEEFTKFTPAEKAHLTGAQTTEITTLLTPLVVASSSSSSSSKVLATFSGTPAPKAAAPIAAAPKAAAAAGTMSVDNFCAMAYDHDADTKINEAIDNGRTSLHETAMGFVATGNKGIGNTALYCACRSPKTTVNIIKKMVYNGFFSNVNIRNNHNRSTPLHGLVERLRDPASDVPGTIEIMKFLIIRADRTLANTVVNGGTALQEFNRFRPEEIARLQGQEAEIATLLTPNAAEIVKAAKDAFHVKLCTNLQVPELEAVIANHYITSAKTWTPQTKGKNGNDTWGPYIGGVMNELTIASAEGTNTFKPAFADIPDVADVGNMLRATTVGDIEKEYLRFFELAKLLPSSPPPKKASFTIVGPFIDGKYTLKSKLARNSIVQVASQFDFLEAPTSAYTEIMGYPHDPTQGPGSSMASLEALILRDAAIKPTTHDGPLQTLGQQPIFNGIPWYKNGYLEPHKEVNQVKLQEAANSITANIGILKILAQESVPEFSISDGGYQCTQVFSAAPSYQSYRDEKGHDVYVSAPTEGSAGAKICEVLVLAQYRSIAKLAVIQSIAEPLKRVNLHLTGVGQGAFNNPSSLFDKFIEEVWNIVEPFNVGVYMHVYGNPSGWDENNSVFVNRVTQINDLFTRIGQSAKTDSGKLPKLTAEQFINHA